MYRSFFHFWVKIAGRNTGVQLMKIIYSSNDQLPEDGEQDIFTKWNANSGEWILYYCLSEQMITSWMGLESSQGGRSMMSLKVSIFFLSSIINMKFPPHALELSIVMPATFFGFLDTYELVPYKNKPFFVKMIIFANSHKIGSTKLKYSVFSWNWLITVWTNFFITNSSVFLQESVWCF